MRSRNYTKEIGVNATERPVPAPVVIAVMALVAVVAFFLIRQVMAYQPAHQEAASAPVSVKVANR